MANRYFGTDGIRDRAGEGLLAHDALVRLGAAIAEATAQTMPPPDPGYDAGGASIVIGRDTRESGAGITQALVQGMRARNAFVVDAGVITTPGVAYLTSRLAGNCGVVVSASHNPAADNGIKLFSPIGSKVDPGFEQLVEQYYDALASTGPGGLQPTEESMLQDNPRAAQVLIDALVSEVGGQGALAGMRVAVDCANGAASAVAPEILEQLGCEVVAQFNQPNGTNINDGCGALVPEVLAKVVTKQGPFNLGIVFDGDADRCILIDETGVVRDGDYILYLWARDLQANEALTNDTVISTTMANIGLELALSDQGVFLVRTDVGDRYVAAAMQEFGAILGGEQSGHVCYFGGDDPVYTGDGIRTALHVLRIMKATDKTLSQLCEGLTKLPQLIVNVPVVTKPDLTAIPGLLAREEQTNAKLGERGRVVLRYSGTEPLFRVMIEGEDATLIQAEADALADLVKTAIGK